LLFVCGWYVFGIFTMDEVWKMKNNKTHNKCSICNKLRYEDEWYCINNNPKLKHLKEQNKLLCIYCASNGGLQ